MKEILYFSLIPILIIASVWDIFRDKKIPNAFIILGMTIGFSYSYIEGGWEELLKSIVIFLVMTLIGFIGLWGIMAAGDVKLIMVISIFLGFGVAIKVTFLSLFIGAICFVLFDWKRFHRSLRMIVNFIFYSVPVRMYSKKQTVAFSPYITVACIIVMFI
ncbi:A24 family peptidase [Priestia filamentosa]|uniref:prepilin peptidase n=1 Tax=Priestia filamentosa TaxID=1402861 RepID=UPI000691A1F7